MSGKGLGPWDSYGVGSKMPPPQPSYQQDMEVQKITYMANMAMAGMQMRHYSAISGQDPFVGPMKPYKYRSHKGLARRGFMQRTRWGFHARKYIELAFWIGTAAFAAGWIVTPVVIKIGTVLWTWALT